MKKTAVAIILAVLILVGSFFLVVTIFGSMTQYNIEEVTTVAGVDATEAENNADDMTRDEMTSEEVTTDSAEAEITEDASTLDSSISDETTQAAYEVDLTISMPEKNGTMVTDGSEDNKYIKIVTDKKDVDADLLLAVFAVPESGQNYVFEFYDKNMTAENIRRVYLIDTDGKITSVAAVKVSEKENLSTIENWFCMNVLIKEVVFPAISENIK